MQLSAASRKKLTNITVSIVLEKYGRHPKKEIKLQYAKSIVNLFKCYAENDGGHGHVNIPTFISTPISYKQ